MTRLWLPLVLVPRLAWGAALLLTFTFPRAYSPPPTHFLLTATSLTTGEVDQLQVAPSALGACAAVPDATPDTFCAQWPACPPEGILVITVQAGWAEGVSAASDPPIACAFTAAAPCQCLPVVLPGERSEGVPGTGDASPGVGGPSVQQAALQTPEGAALPTFPALPVVTPT